MQQGKRKQKQNKKNVPRDNYAKAVEYNKKYHSLVKTEDGLMKYLLEFTIRLSEKADSPVTGSDLMGVMGFAHALAWTYSKRVETRCVMNEYLLEDTWDTLKSVAKRVHTKADIENLAILDQRLANMRKEDAILNEKFDKIEPFLESFENFLEDKGLKRTDLFKFSQKPPTKSEQP